MTNNPEQMSDQELINTEITTLENMNDLLKEDTENVKNAIIESPTEVVERRLSDFVADAFNATNKDFAFQERLKDELLKRVGSLTDAQLINLFSNNFVNLNDRVSKVIAPTFGMMQTKQQAEIASAKQLAAQQIIVNPQGGGANSPISNPTQSMSGDAKDISDILAGGTVLTQLLQALGQETPKPTVDPSQS
jgi:hypothetical protein